MNHLIPSAETTACILERLNQWKKEKDGLPVPPTEASFRRTLMQDKRQERSLIHQRTGGRGEEQRSDQGAVILRLDGDWKAFKKKTLTAQPPTQHTAPASNTHTHQR